MDNQGYPEQRYVVTALLRYIIAAVAFVILVGLFAWFFFFRGTDTSNKTTQSGKDNTGSSQQVTDNSTNGSTPSDSNANTGTKPSTSTKTTGGNVNADGSSSTTNTEQNAGTDQLTNTGPGDVIALFVVTVLVSAAGYKWFAQNAKQFNR